MQNKQKFSANTKKKILCIHFQALFFPTCNASGYGKTFFLFKSHRIFIMKFHLRVPHGSRNCKHVSFYIRRRKISFLMTLNQMVLDINAQGKVGSFVWKKHKTFDLKQIDFFLSTDRFMYWRVCCYMCTREPKKKKRQMMRRETYRQQQQQLALQDRSR